MCPRALKNKHNNKARINDQSLIQAAFNLAFYKEIFSLNVHENDLMYQPPIDFHEVLN